MTTTSPARRLPAVLVLCLCAAPAFGQPPAGKPADPDDPFVPGAAAKPAPGKPVWTGAEVAVPVRHDTPVTFGPPGSPLAVVGAEVWDLARNKMVGKLDGPVPDRDGLRAVSAEGKYFAAADKSPNQTGTAAAVWELATGRRVLDVPGSPAAYLDVLALSRDKYLIVGGRHSRELAVWDVEAGKVARRLTVPDRRVDPRGLAFAPDGRYFAAVAGDRIVVTATASNAPAASMAPPNAGPRRPGNLNATFALSWMTGMAFAPDGGHLAVATTHPVARLMVWDAKGKPTADLPLPVDRGETIGRAAALEWLPDGSGWLAHNRLVDRATGRVAAVLKTPFGGSVPPHLLDNDRVAGTFGDDRDRLTVRAVPWDRVRASLKQLAAKADTFVAPGEPVSVEVALAGTRGDEAETRGLITAALTERLARDGVPVAAGRPTVLRLRLAESAGDTLPVYERQSPFDLRGKDTGRRATEAKGAAVLELTARGEAGPLWRAALSATSARSFQEDVNDASVRKSMLDGLARQLAGLDIPYFVPKSRELIALPVVIE